MQKTTGFRANGVAAPAVVRSGSNYYMWYTGIDGNKNPSIGYAVATHVDLSLLPAQQSVNAGDNFNVTIQAQTGDPITSVAAYVDYDSNYLQVISVTNGTTLTESISESHSVAGQINYSAAKAAGASGTFTVATITFRALATVTNTPVAFHSDGSRATDVRIGATSMLRSLSGAKVTVGAAVAPRVISTSPTANATNVPVSTLVTATFDKAMNPATITTTSFLLSGSGPVTGVVTVSTDNRTATFTPSANLAYNTLYTANLTDDITDLAGNRLEEYGWRFTTGIAPDTTPPTVVSTSPANNATNVQVNTVVTANFSEAMRAASITTGQFTLYRVGFGPVNGTVTVSTDNLSATFTPSGNLASNQSYTANVTTDVVDLAGNPLAAARTWSFTTETVLDTTPPYVVSTVPTDNATGVAVGTAVVANFSKAIKASTVTGTSFYLTSGSTPVTGTVTVSTDNLSATFTPGANLNYSNNYTATLTTDITDLVGNRLLGLGGQSFSQAITIQSLVWSVPVTVATASDGINTSLGFGIDTVSTDGLDANDVASPPPDPSGKFDVYFSIVDDFFPKLNTDMRGTGTTVVWTLVLAGTSTQSRVVSWNATAAPSNVSLTLTRSGASPIDMKTTSNVTLAGGSYTLTITAVTVIPPTLVSIAVTPASATILVGGTQQYIATGTYSDNSTQNITNSVTWSSNNTAIATISNSGLASGSGAGTVGITATSGSVISNAATLRVYGIAYQWRFTTAAVVSPAVTTTAATGITTNSAIVSGNLTSLGTATTVNVSFEYGTSTSYGSSTNAQVMTATGVFSTNLSGLNPATLYHFRAKADGGTYGSATGSDMTFTTLSPVDTTPPYVVSTVPTTNAVGVSVTTAVVANFSEAIKASTVNTNSFYLLGSDAVAGTVTVSSDNLSATFTPSGALDASHTYTAVLTPDITDLAGNPLVGSGGQGNVYAASIQSLVWSVPVTVATASDGNNPNLGFGIDTGSTDGLDANDVTSPPPDPTGKFDAYFSIVDELFPKLNTDMRGTGATVVWTLVIAGTSTQSRVVSWNAAGAPSNMSLTLSSTGIADIDMKSSSNVTFAAGSRNVTITAAAVTLSSIAVTPSTASIAVGETQQYTAMGTYSDNSTQNITNSVTWNSNNTAVAYINSSTGLASGRATGTAGITATSGNITSPSATLTVIAPRLISVWVEPYHALVNVGQTRQFSAYGFYTDNTSANLTASATWSSNNTAVATIISTGTNAGLATARAQGNAGITATSGTITSYPVMLMVEPPAVVSIAVTPSSAAITVGGTQRFTATATYTDQSTADITATAYWLSDNTTVAMGGNNGTFVGQAAGIARITAIYGAATSPAVTLKVIDYAYKWSFTTGTTVGNPSVLSTSPIDNATGVPINTVVTASFDRAMNPATINTASFLLSGGGTVTGTVTVSTNNLTATFTPAANLAQGTLYTATLTTAVADASGRPLTANYVWRFTTGTMPVATLSGAPQGTVNYNFANITVGGTGVTHYKYALDNGAYGAETPVSQIIALTGLADGEHTVYVLGKNATGWQITPAKASWTVVTVTPVAVLSGQPVGLVSYNYANINVSGTGVVSYQYKLDAGSYSAETSVAYSINLSNLADGEHTVYVLGKNAAGTWQVTPTLATWTVDTTGPVVSSTSPASGATGVAVTTLITVNFSERMAASTINTDSFFVYGSSVRGFVDGTVTVSSDNRSATFAPAAALAYEQLHTAILTSEITDLAGNSLTDTSWSFATEVLPIATLTGQPVGLVNYRTANIEVGGDGVTSYRYKVDAGNYGNWTPISANITLTGLSDGEHTLYVRGRNDAGTEQSGQTPTTATWTVEATLPTVVVFPSNGATGVPVYTAVTATFSEDIDAATISQSSMTVSDTGPITGTLSYDPSTRTATFTPWLSLKYSQLHTVTLSSTITDLNGNHLALFNGTFTTQAPPATTDLALIPASQSVITGNNLVVDIQVNTNGQGVSSVSAFLNFDPSKLQVVSVTSGGLLTPGTSNSFNNTLGNVDFSAAKSVAPYPAGIFTLATVTFRATAPVNSSPVSFNTGAGRITDALYLASSVLRSTTPATVTVEAVVLTRLEVSPPSATIALGQAKQFTVRGTYSDGSSNVTTGVNWSSSDTNIATVNSNGYATSVGIGSVLIWAEKGGIESDAALLDITAPVLTAITVKPVSPSIAAGRTIQFTANGTYSDGSWADMTDVVFWTSSNTAVASISATGGLASGATTGSTTITATDILSGVPGNTTLTVTVKEVVSFVLSPARPLIAAGTTIQFTARAYYTDGSQEEVTAASTWNSSNTTAVTMVGAGLAAGMVKGSSTISATWSGYTLPATTLLTVTDPVLVSVAIREPAPTVALGRSVQLHVDGTYSDASIKDLTSDNMTTWASLDLSVATISPTGNATSKKVGVVTIRATHRGLRSTTNLTVTRAVLEGITVTPASPKVAVGAALQFTATGIYSDGSRPTLPTLTDSVAWTSSDVTIATITTGGVATATKVGSTNIIATSGSISNFTTLTVTGAVLQTITVTPANSSVAAGRTAQFKATGTYSDNSTANITAQVTWASTDTARATISAGGLATGLVAGGLTTIRATDPQSGVFGTTTLTVTAAELVSIAVTPVNPSRAVGRTVQFTATGTYSNGTTVPLTTGVTWASTDASKASINPATGLALARAVGTVTITAALSGKTGETTMTVTPKELVSISLSPATVSLAAGRTQQLSATGTYTDNTTPDITSLVTTWSSSNTAVASVTATGLVDTYATGTATISASLGTATPGTAVITVTKAVLDSIAVTPDDPTIFINTTQRFRATGTYSDGTNDSITGKVTWSSNDTAVATIATSGLARGLKAGKAAITATLEGVTSPVVTLTVTAAQLVSLQVTPTLPSVAAGRTQQFSAIGSFADNTTADLTGLVDWSSSNTSAARIQRNTGLATTRAQGTTRITASTANVTSPAVILTVTAAELEAIRVTPTNRRVTLEPPKPTRVEYKARGIYTDGDTKDITDLATWTSSNTATATLAAGGKATAVAEGTVTVTAVLGSVSGTATLTVLPDRTAPKIELESPTEGLVQREKNLTVRGEVDDTSAGVTILVNGVSTNVTLNGDGEFAQGVALKTGGNSVEVRAVDSSGNIGRSPTITVTVDIKKPTVTITSPAGGLLTNKTTPLAVTGNVTGATSATLWFNGVASTSPLTVVGGGFATSVTLKKGVNLIVVTAYATEGPGDSDYLGTSGIVVVSLDSDAPVVTLDSPIDGSVLNTPLARVSGTVNDPFTSNVTLALNGVPQSVAVAGGTFSQDISLQPGLNTVTVVAIDKAGNTSLATPIRVTLNTAAPKVTLVAPVHRSLMNIAAQTINGTLSDPTIETATLYLNSDAPRTISVAPDGTFNQIVSLARGANRIEVRATATDNVTTGTSGNVTVTLDDSAPGIKVDLYDPTDAVVITVTSNETLGAAPVVRVIPATVAPLAQPVMLPIGINGWAGTYGSAATPIAIDTYTVNVTGRDVAGNTATVTATFVKKTIDSNGVDPTTVSSGTSSVDVVTDGAVANADISLTNHLGNPSGSFMTPTGAGNEAGAFVEIIAAPELFDNLNRNRRILIKVGYDRAAFLTTGGDESTLRLYEWNVTTGTWGPIPDPYSGVNMTATPPYIWGYVEHLSKYGGFGKAVTTGGGGETPGPQPTTGGGAAPAPSGTTTLTGSIDSQGVITNPNGVVATSADGKVDLTLPRGTKALSKEGVPLSQITMVSMSEPATPPAGTKVVGLVYDFGPSGATFAPPITVRFKYDVASLPKGIPESKLLVYMLDATGRWTQLDGVIVDTVNHVITAKVSHFTIFAVVASTRPASFAVSELAVSPAEVKPKDTVTISVTAKNSGDLSGSYPVALKINGAVIETKEVTLAGGASATVTFTITRDNEGTYTVDVNGLTGKFVVKAGALPPKPAAFTVSALTVSPAEVEIKQPVTVSIAVRNTGEAAGNYSVTLKINGVNVETKSVAVAGGASQTVTFTLTRDAAGTYAVDVNGLTGTFVVKPGAVEPVVPPTKGVNLWLIIGIIVLVIAVALGGLWFVRRRS